MMGEILKRRGWTRDTFVVSSKVFWGGDLPNQEGLSRKHVIRSVSRCACAGCRSIISIFIFVIGPIRTRRSRKRCGR